VYARSTTFEGRPDSIDVGITFINTEVGPMFDQIEGCRGLSRLVDRETGQCIATSSRDPSRARADSRNLQRQSVREPVDRPGLRNHSLGDPRCDGSRPLIG
jgi:hypothetical protein